MCSISKITQLYNFIQDELYRPKEYDVYLFLEKIEAIHSADEREVTDVIAYTNNNKVILKIYLDDEEIKLYTFSV